MALRVKGPSVLAVAVTLCGLVGGGRDAHAGGIICGHGYGNASR